MSDYLRFRQAFASVLDPRLYTIDWLDRQIVTGAAKFWATESAAIIAQIKTYPTGAMDIEGLIAAGDMDDIIGKLIPAAEQWARAVGCVGAIIQSRQGWARALKPHGYSIYQTALRKEL